MNILYAERMSDNANKYEEVDVSPVYFSRKDRDADHDLSGIESGRDKCVGGRKVR